MSRPFAARFSGPCAAEDCGRRIAPDDVVQYVEDELMHEQCARDVAATTPGQPLGRLTAPCAECHLFHAGDCW